MDNTKIIEIDNATKIQYFLYNLFAPISFAFICIMVFNVYKSHWALLTVFLVIIISPIVAVIYHKKYNRYLIVNNDTVYVCKGKNEKRKVIETIHINELPQNSFTKDFEIQIAKRKLNLLYTKIPLLYIIIYSGPLVFIPLLKQDNVLKYQLSEFRHLLKLNGADSSAKKPVSLNKIGGDILMWLFTAFVTIIGIIPILVFIFSVIYTIIKH